MKTQFYCRFDELILVYIQTDQTAITISTIKAQTLKSLELDSTNLQCLNVCLSVFCFLLSASLSEPMRVIPTQFGDSLI